MVSQLERPVPKLLPASLQFLKELVVERMRFSADSVDTTHSVALRTTCGNREAKL